MITFKKKITIKCLTFFFFGFAKEEKGNEKKKSVKKGIQCVGGIGMEELERVIEFQDKVIIEYQGKVEEVEGKDVGLYEYKNRA